MKKKSLLIISYNRPEKLMQVLKSINIKYIKDIYFYNNYFHSKSDKENVEKCRELIRKFKYPGKKKYLFNKEHLDVKKSILKSIDWFFKNTKEGIILEDDIVPSKSFYYFCSSLIDRYRENKTIFHISGFNHLEKIVSPYSYNYNFITHVWGWATWSDRWKDFRKNLRNKNLKISNKELFIDKNINKYRGYLYKRTLSNKIVTWDYLWDLHIRLRGGLCIRPNLNLVKNIGFDFKATNTKFQKKKIKKIKTFEIKKINYPELIYYNSNNDRRYFDLYEKRNLTLKKNYDFIKGIIKKII